MNIVTIYIRLLDEGTEVSRPAQAEQIEDGIFRLLASPDYDAEDERWEFVPGTIVHAERRADSEGEFLLAVAQLRQRPA